MEKAVSVDKETSHQSIVYKKWIGFVELGRKGLNLYIGVWLSYKLYSECLFCSNCSTVVQIHLSVLAFVAFINCGIPVEKLVKVTSLS